VVPVELVGALGRLDHRGLGLLLGAHEHHGAALAHAVGDEGVGAAEQAHGLLQVDDVDAVAGAEDVRLHLRVPALGLVAEVDAGLEQIPHREQGGIGGLHRGFHDGVFGIAHLSLRLSGPGHPGPGRHRLLLRQQHRVGGAPGATDRPLRSGGVRDRPPAGDGCI